MSKSKITYTGTIEELLSKNILVNINYLKDGNYSLKIMHKNKIIKEVSFSKNSLDQSTED